MLYIKNIADVIPYILKSFKFDVQTPSGWCGHAKTCRSGERPLLSLRFVNEDFTRNQSNGAKYD